jgi:Tol biopolymer transport system component
MVISIESNTAQLIVENTVSQASRPVWSPRGDWILFENRAGMIDTLHVHEGRPEELEEGESPTFSPDGSSIAFLRGNELFIRPFEGGRADRLDAGPMRGIPKRGLSWSPDGRCLTFGSTAGLTSKETDFFLLDIEMGRVQRTAVRHLSGLQLITLEDDNPPQGLPPTARIRKRGLS